MGGESYTFYHELNKKALKDDRVILQIPNFNPEVAIYESSKFDHADQSWNFSFGHNNANGYGEQ